MRCCSAVWLCFALLLASSASAQTIRGTVRDVTTQEPLGSTLIMVVDRFQVVRAAVMSNASGDFRLRVPEVDSGVVRVQRIGYKTVESVPMAFGISSPDRFEIRLRPDAVALEGVTATVTSRRRHNLERFLTRQRLGFGQFLGPEEISRMRPRSTLHLLIGMPGALLLPGPSGRGLVAKMPPKSTRRETTCIPTVFVDGLRMVEHTTSSSEQYVPVESFVGGRAVRAVEVYRSPSTAPPEFRRPFMSDCAVVVIWTAYGFGSPT